MGLGWTWDEAAAVPRVVLEGDLDGDADLSELRLTQDRVVFDMSGVHSATREGSRALLALLRRVRLDQSLEIRRCPAAVVDLLRQTPALAMRLVIKSTLAELRCIACGLARPVLVRVPEGLSGVAQHPCSSCGAEVMASPETARLIAELCDPSLRQRPGRPGKPLVARAPRHRVHLNVRYKTAQEFVENYAQDLSDGGLFIRGAERVAMNTQVEVEVELPGFGTYKVAGRVAHILDAERAAEVDKAPGAGLELTTCTIEFTDALERYIGRLERRREAFVVGTSTLVCSHVERFGYRSLEVKSAADLAAEIARSDGVVVGIVTGRREEQAFRDAAKIHGLDDLVASIDYLEEVDELLPTMDDLLPL
jgi:uncharacterized protein (TIGR02266 family)